MDWFPEPFPDESFYSVLVRLHRYLGRPSYATFARAISGRRHLVALAHIPCGLSNLAARFGWSAEKLSEIIDRTTLLSYHTAFADQGVRDKAIRQVKGKGASLQFMLGLATFPISPPSHLQFCGGCLADQLSETGEGWWRRSHQLPAVLVCTEHKRWLSKSAIAIAPENRHLLVLPQDGVGGLVEAHGRDVCARAPPQRLLELAKLSADLLLDPPEPRFAEGHHEGLQDMLADRGLQRGTRHIRLAEIEGIVGAYWGDALDAVPGLSLSPDGPRWIRELLRNKRRLAPPAQHLVLRAALECADRIERPFGPPPWPCFNPLSSHFRERVVMRQRLVRDRGKLHGHFSCECGYSYSRTRQLDGTIGKPCLRDFGPAASNFLRSSSGRRMSLRAKARAMRVDPKTVIRLEGNLQQSSAGLRQGSRGSSLD